MKEIENDKKDINVEKIKDKIDDVMIINLLMFIAILYLIEKIRKISNITNELGLSELLIFFASAIVLVYLFKMYYKPKNN